MDTNAKELVELLGEPNTKGGGNHRVSQPSVSVLAGRQIASLGGTVVVI